MSRFAMEHDQPHMLHQRLQRRHALFKIGKRVAYSMLSVTIVDLLYLANVYQFSGVTNGVTTAVKYALLLYGVKSNLCLSVNQLRCNYACESDTSASLFPPTDGTFQQYTRCVKYTRWLCGSTVLKQNQFFVILMSIDGS